MGDRAFVCICVDGQSDIDALQLPFQDLFDQIGHDDIDVKFRFPKFQKKNHGDITSMTGVTSENIEKHIYKFYFKDQDKKSDWGWDDVTTIIHIIDLDGAYVPPDDIKLFTEAEETLADSLVTDGEPKNTLYLGDHIAVRKNLPLRQETLLRKRKNIEHLLSLDEISVGRRKVRYMRQALDKLSTIQELQKFQLAKDRDRDIFGPFLLARKYVLRAELQTNPDERRALLLRADDEMTKAIHAVMQDIHTTSGSLADVASRPYNNVTHTMDAYMNYLAQDM